MASQQYHPDPPYWYKHFSASSSALSPPTLDGLPSPAVMADRHTFAHPIHRPPPVPAAAHVSDPSVPKLCPRKIHSELKDSKTAVVQDFMDMLEIVSQGDPTLPYVSRSCVLNPSIYILPHY